MFFVVALMLLALNNHILLLYEGFLINRTVRTFIEKQIGYFCIYALIYLHTHLLTMYIGSIDTKASISHLKIVITKSY